MPDNGSYNRAPTDPGNSNSRFGLIKNLLVQRGRSDFFEDQCIGGYQAYPENNGCRLFGCFGPNLYPESAFHERGFYAPGTKGNNQHDFPLPHQWAAIDQKIRTTKFLDSANAFYASKGTYRDLLGRQSEERNARAYFKDMKKDWELEGNKILEPLGLKCKVTLWNHVSFIGDDTSLVDELVIRILTL